MTFKKTVPDETWAEVKKSYLEGHSFRQLGKMYNINPATINKRCRADMWIKEAAEGFEVKRAVKVTEAHILSTEPIISDDTSLDAPLNENALTLDKPDQQVLASAVIDFMKLKRYAYTTQANFFSLSNKILTKVDELITKNGSLMYVSSIDSKGNQRYGRITEFVKDIAPLMQAANGILGFSSGANNINITNLNGEMDSTHGNKIVVELVQPHKAISEGEIIDVGGEERES